VESPDGERDPKFVVTDDERKACDAQFENGRLRVRLKRWWRVGTAALGVFYVAFIALSITLGPVGIVFVAFGLWGIAAVLITMTGQVVASPEAVSVRFVRTRQIPWSRVDHFAVVERMRWWAPGRFWPRPLIVEVALRNGDHVALWPTMGHDPIPTSRTLWLLQRYRETFAPPP